MRSKAIPFFFSFLQTSFNYYGLSVIVEAIKQTILCDKLGFDLCLSAKAEVCKAYINEYLRLKAL